MRTHRVVVVAFDGLQSLDLTGPVEVLRTATRLGAEPDYETVLATPGGRRVRTESGLELGADRALADVARSRERIDTLMVVGGDGTRALMSDAEFVADLARIGRRAGRITSICSGALLLAAAGLLDGYEATSHWGVCELLSERFPAIDVQADRIYVQDRNRWTSAGVTAGIDLALALVEHDHGAALAHEIAAWLVVFVRRPGGQSQFSAQLRAQPAEDRAISSTQRWLSDHLTEELSVEQLASRAAMSPRTFARAFRRETGTTPAAYVETVRVEAARRYLEESDLTVAAIAQRVGMRHAETLHRAFRRRVGTTPDLYRQHFGRQAS
jgi:transcriptional regulator GlxA family with amidase domain